MLTSFGFTLLGKPMLDIGPQGPGAMPFVLEHVEQALAKFDQLRTEAPLS